VKTTLRKKRSNKKY